MSSILQDTPKSFSDAHVQVSKILERAGLEIMEEVSFPPFSADVYIPSHHIVVEIDGPQHERKRDEKRDKKLLEEYGLPVFHIPAAQAKQPRKWWDDFVSFMNEAEKTVDERVVKCEDKGL